ncbi:hypothetical protein CHS0354_023021 [Potamilus streckersoni]|uniref:Uncharacterized protein n=1 Tax=Potamilus streckersoni TaxID=2493646 RepID=A0AAE0VKA5_9BIVA|nr:hypothetical protein CHS0354_023021 [Potamilus streckersoni]
MTTSHTQQAGDADDPVMVGVKSLVRMEMPERVQLRTTYQLFMLSDCGNEHLAECTQTENHMGVMVSVV